jgi:tetratricopeptide (TPR) repeat protein
MFEMVMARASAIACGYEDAIGGFITAWFAAPERAADAKLPPEDWPICTSMAAMGSEADWAQLDPDFAAGKKALVAAPHCAIRATPISQNYIGYEYRRLRQLGPAMQHYQQALRLNGRHRSAHEHLGELYLLLGEPTAAEQQLAGLEDICLIPCVETDDLRRAIAAYKTLATR